MNADDYLDHMYEQGYYDNSRELQTKKEVNTCFKCKHYERHMCLPTFPEKYICNLHREKYLSSEERFTNSCEDFEKFNQMI